MHDLAAGEDQQLAGEPDRPLRRVADLLDVVEHAAQPRVLARQAGYLLREQVGKAGDHVQQVVEVVRDAADQLAQALHPLGMPQPVLRRGPLGVGAHDISHQPGVIDGLGAPLSQVGAELKVGVVVRLVGHITEGSEDAECRARRDQRRNDQTAESGASGYLASVVRQPGAGGLEPGHQDRLTTSQRSPGKASVTGAGCPSTESLNACARTASLWWVAVGSRNSPDSSSRRICSSHPGPAPSSSHQVEDHVQVQARAEQLAGLGDHRKPPALSGGQASASPNAY